MVMFPNENLPKPEPPRGVNGEVHKIGSEENGSGSIGKYLRDRKNSLTKALSRRLSLDDVGKGDNVTEFRVSGVRVVVRAKEEGDNDEDVPYNLEQKVGSSEMGLLEGRVTFLSRSNCRDSGAVTKMLKHKGLKYVEINIDAFPSREKELMDRTGSLAVPQVFFNEKLIGGLVALNSLRNSGLLDRTAKELLGRKCPDDAPGPPVYGFDEPEEEKTDEMGGIVKILRLRLPIQDRLVRMRLVRICFIGKELVYVLVHHLGCPRNEATEVGREIVRKHFIHHVFGGTHFEDGNELYRLLEHEQFIPKCFNFRGSTDDREPESASVILQTDENHVFYT